MRLNSLAVPAISLLLVAGSALASSPVIGVASATGGMTLNNASASGGATVFDGDTVETSGYSRIRLGNGAHVDLSAGSKAQIFANHEVLQSGMSESSGVEVDARTLKIQPSAATSVARVRLDGDQAVIVVALNSPVSVLDKEGLLVARVLPGAPLSFLPQAGNTAASVPAADKVDATGCLLQKGGSVVLVDPDGTKVSELKSTKTFKFDPSLIGSKVRVVGVVDRADTPSPSSGAQQVVVFGGMKRTQKGGCGDVATKVGATAVAAGAAVAIPVATGGAVAAGTAIAAGAGVGIAAGVSTVVIVGAVAAGAAAAGIGAAVATSGKSSP